MDNPLQRALKFSDLNGPWAQDSVIARRNTECGSLSSTHFSHIAETVCHWEQFSSYMFYRAPECYWTHQYSTVHHLLKPKPLLPTATRPNLSRRPQSAQHLWSQCQWSEQNEAWSWQRTWETAIFLFLNIKSKSQTFQYEGPVTYFWQFATWVGCDDHWPN